jgi:hypothetical protein
VPSGWSLYQLGLHTPHSFDHLGFTRESEPLKCFWVVARQILPREEIRQSISYRETLSGANKSSPALTFETRHGHLVATINKHRKNFASVSYNSFSLWKIRVCGIKRFDDGLDLLRY